MAHKHSVYDSDTHFSINPLTRALKNESSTKNSVIQHDHNSERVTFEIPRYFEDHDMSQCNVVQVHYINIDSQTGEKNVGIYTVDDLQVFPDDEKTVVLSWLISHNATKLVGPLHFLLRFSCVAEDGTIDYAWNTAVYSGFTVASGIYNSEQIEETYADVLEQWRKDIVNGKTAYEYAQDGGYTGTETEFAAKLAQEYTQPDLNLPENVLGGIKNRTHYKEGGLTVIVPEGKPWLPEGAESDDEFYLTHTAPLQAGEKYVVHIDGEEFICIGQDLSAMQPGMTAIGDCSIWGIPGLTGSGEPFLIVYIPNQNGMELMGYMPLTEISELPTVSVYHDGVTVHKLPNEYLDMEWIPVSNKEQILVYSAELNIGAGGWRDYTSPLFSLTDGEEYTVMWNGTAYTCIGHNRVYTANGDSARLIWIGNASKGFYIEKITGRAEDTGEPFLYECVTMLDGTVVLSRVRGEESEDGTAVNVEIIGNNYIPNRIPRKFLPEDMYGTEGGNGGDILPETTLEFPADAEPVYPLMNTVNLVVGETYSVSWNGTEYLCTAQEYSEDGLTGIMMGNFGAMMEGGTDTGEPFVMVYAPDAYEPPMTGMIVALDGSITVTFAIAGGGEVVHKIPNKYLDLEWLPTLVKGTVPVFDGTVHLATSKMYTFESPLFGMVAGETYWVTWDGMEYECKANAKLADDPDFGTVRFKWLGNAALDNSLIGAFVSDDTGEPFLYEEFYFPNGTFTGYVVGTKGDAEIPVRIIGRGPNKMPKEYLPESVDHVIINSSTEGSTKKFKLTVNDSGTITATEVTE